jgi:DNA-binding IclR family transcriptional regulator
MELQSRSTKWCSTALGYEPADGRDLPLHARAYSRILTSAQKPAERLALAAEFGSSVRISEERVDPREVASIVAEACAVRNGWKVILARCAPTQRPRSALQHLREMWAAEDAARRASSCDEL